MAIQRYGLYSAFFDTGASGLALTQLRSIGTRPNKNMMTVHPSGSIDPAAHIMTAARPTIQFVSQDLATIFGAAVPVSISAGLAVPDVTTLMYRRRVAGGAFSSGSDHAVQTVATGFLHATEISADAESQDAAQCTLEFIGLSSTGANPFTFTDDQSVPGALSSPAYNSSFFLGPAYLASAQLEGLIRTRIRPGIGFQSRHADGGSFPRLAGSSINSRNPAIELEFLKVDMIDSVIGDIMVGAFSSTLSIYLQKGSTNDEGRVAPATAEHISIAAAAGSWGPDDVSVADENDATLTLMIQPTGTLSLNAATALP